MAPSAGDATLNSTAHHATYGQWDDLVPADPFLRETHMFYLLLGAFICFFSIVSLLIKEKLYMSEAMVATLFGAIVGPFVLKFFHPFDSFGQSLGMITLEVSRIVIAVQVMACGIDLPKDYIWKEKMSMFMLIVPNMIVKWVVSGLGIYWIIGMPFLEALVIAACLTPTDPVLANSIVKGKFAERHIPENVRLILSAESGMNDGLGTPFLFLALYLMRYPTTGGAIGAWLWRVVIYQIVVGALVGVVMAMAALWILKIAVKRDWIDRESLVFFWLALAITIMGVVSLYGGDDILAVFIAGNVLSWDGWINEQVKGAHFQETIDYFLNLSYFIYFGAVLPWSHIGKPSLSSNLSLSLFGCCSSVDSPLSWRYHRGYLRFETSRKRFLQAGLDRWGRLRFLWIDCESIPGGG
ncbi:Sodium/hydrogen exchanger family-domain-containing protein [Chytridium lagenaria]|nr:Sodium/hydrogen exchanger family-domain-containing protein [Chytridium lagenaria]